VGRLGRKLGKGLVVLMAGSIGLFGGKASAWDENGYYLRVYGEHEEELAELVQEEVHDHMVNFTLNVYQDTDHSEVEGANVRIAGYGASMEERLTPLVKKITGYGGEVMNYVNYYLLRDENEVRYYPEGYPSEGDTLSFTTDENGQVQLQLYTPGRIYVEVQKDGFVFEPYEKLKLRLGENSKGQPLTVDPVSVNVKFGKPKPNKMR